jgi:2-keto-3-deoxy-L-rhamnonate aldolase RhmA
MKFYPLRKRIKENFLLGTFITLPSPALVESMGPIGFDILCLDAEHGALGIVELEDLIRAADLANLPALVRVQDVGAEISRVLDLGAAGIIVPRVETAEQAREVVQRARYAPEGGRGAGAGRASDYGMQLQSYLTTANQNLLVIVQIETARGLAAVDEIAAVPGLDGLCMGPLDLSISMGQTMDSPAHAAAIKRIFDAAKRNELAAITALGDVDAVSAARDEGFSMVFFSAERFFLLQAMHEAAAAVAKSRTVATSS